MVIDNSQLIPGDAASHIEVVSPPEGQTLPSFCLVACLGLCSACIGGVQMYSVGTCASASMCVDG